MMKKLFSLFLVLMLLFSASAFAEEENPVMHVTGSASISLPADTAHLQIGVATEDTDLSVAQNKNTILMNEVIDSLKKAGVPAEDMTTSNFNVYSYMNDDATRYNISNTLSVTVHDLNQVGRIMDIAVKSGANQMYGLTFSSSLQKDTYRQALKRAVDDAKEKAQLLSEAAGVTLGKLLVVDARDMTPVYGITNVYEAEGKGDAAPIISGNVEVTASVTLTWEMR